MNVYIIRHAWAEQANEARWPDDSLRPLTEEGRRRFRRAARRLGRLGINPRLVVTSPYLRCIETAEILVATSQEPMLMETIPFLAPGGDVRALIEWAQSRMAEVAGDMAWVGHAPDVSEILATLIGGGQFRFAKGGVATVRFKNHIVPGEGELIFFASPSMFS